MSDRTHEHAHDHDRDADHDHGHLEGSDRHSHGPDGHSHEPGEHGHEHPIGIRGFFYGLFVPHSHDAADSIDDALEASSVGIRTLKITLILLGVTAAIQVVIVAISGSVALLADTIHNFSDALTAIPLWIAFALSRRAVTRKYTWGYGRVEDLAGLFIVAMIALSAIIAAWESIRRILNPQPLENLGWVLVAGIVGFMGNEVVAVYRIRTGRRIGSAALVADGVHARTDGFTSLAVVVGVIGVWIGLPWADPAIGLIISAAIFVLLWATARDIGRRLLDGVDPELTDRAQTALIKIRNVDSVQTVRLRWSGHRLNIQARVRTPADLTVSQFHSLEHEIDTAVRQAIPNVGLIDITPAPTGHDR